MTPEMTPSWQRKAFGVSILAVLALASVFNNVKGSIIDLGDAPELLEEVRHMTDISRYLKQCYLAANPGEVGMERALGQVLSAKNARDIHDKLFSISSCIYSFIDETNGESCDFLTTRGLTFMPQFQQVDKTFKLLNGQSYSTFLSKNMCNAYSRIQHGKKQEEARSRSKRSETYQYQNLNPKKYQKESVSRDGYHYPSYEHEASSNHLDQSYALDVYDHYDSHLYKTDSGVLPVLLFGGITTVLSAVAAGALIASQRTTGEPGFPGNTGPTGIPGTPGTDGTPA